MTTGERRAAVLTNEVSLAALGTCVIGSSILLSVGSTNAARIVFGLQTLTYALVPLLMRAGHTRLAPRVLVIGAVVWLSATTILRGAASGFSFICCPSSSARGPS